LVKTENLPDGFTKYHWKVVNPINNYNVALNIGDYLHFQERYRGEKGLLDIGYYILRENNSKKNKKHLRKNVTQTLAALEHWFGPYPFYEDSYKIVETPYLGMEHQSAIAYGNRFMNGYLGADRSHTGWGNKWDFIVVHESGHEWFGNNITAKDVADMWIHESFTTYSEALFIDYHFGKEAGNAYLYGLRAGILNDSPMQGPFDVNKEGSVDMYIKGSILHHMIRTMLDNDMQWRNVLRGLNKKFYHQQVDYTAILNEMCASTGINLRPIFAQYIQHRDIPKLEVKEGENGGVMARWITDVPNFSMPIHLGIKGQNLQRVNLTAAFSQVPIAGLSTQNLQVDTLNYFIDLRVQ